jgi:predicted transposase/invertase (TIGR01784 family)
MNRLIGVVAKDADNVKGEVINMGGRVLELQSDKFRKEISQSRQEGIQKGMKKGRQEAIAMMVVNMSQNNMTTQQIASIARISVDEVEEILRREQ